MLPFGSFFEELDFGEQPPPRERRGSRAPARGDEPYEDDYDDDPPGGGGGRRRGFELRRIVLLVVAVLLLAVGGYWYVQRCQRAEEVDAYRNYVKAANSVTTQANRVGASLSESVLKSGQTPDALVSELEAHAKQQQAVVTAAQALDPPGPLRELQARFLEAQQLRMNGLGGMAKALPDAFGSGGTVAADKAEQIALLYARIVAGDIVYTDSFKAPSERILTTKNVSGVAFDDSEFVTAELLRFVNPDSMGARLQAIGGGTGTTPEPSPNCDPNDANDPDCAPTEPQPGLHGTSIEGVALNGVPLDPNAVVEVQSNADGENIITVTIKNGGDFQETQIQVQALANGLPVGDKSVIPVLDAGSTADVSIPWEPLLGKKVTIKINVDTVAGEKNTDNNSRSYSVLVKIS
jgi:CARDB